VESTSMFWLDVCTTTDANLVHSTGGAAVIAYIDGKFSVRYTEFGDDRRVSLESRSTLADVTAMFAGRQDRQPYASYCAIAAGKACRSESSFSHIP